MCGINGFNWKNLTLIEKMNKSIKHRGPDNDNIYVDNKVSLGHVRLSIIDLSSAGNQPMSNDDESVWISYNGEVYNFLELRKELEEKGYKFKSNTDTEAILHAYEEWGYNCVERFDGMWAFVLYDKNKNKLFLSRDRFGIKSQYYYWDKNKFIFSSEIKGILSHDIDRIPNDKVIYEYLAFGLLDYSKETFFRNIFRVMPGENIIYDISERTLKTFKWYDLKNKIGKFEKNSDDEIIKKIRNLFSDSVHSHLIADVPVGSCLSGGIDSSSIVCSIKKFEKNNKIKTFSLVFPRSELDESCYIDEVVKYTNVEPYKISLIAGNLIDDLYDLIRTQEEPFVSLSIYGQYKVMELAHANDMKVLLDGQGADELFAGYFGYHKYYLFECLINLKIKRFLQIEGDNKTKLVLLVKFLLNNFGLTKKIKINIQLKKLKLLNDFYNYNISIPLFAKDYKLNQVLFNDLTKYSIPQLLRYEDKNSMRWSIESRVPFLDHRFVEYVFSLPYDIKIRGNITKYAFRESMSGIVPLKILERRDKIGFETPDKEWIRAPEFIKVIREIINSNNFKSRKYWKYEEFTKLYEEHLRIEEDNTGIIWRVINTELWLRVFIDKKD